MSRQRTWLGPVVVTAAALALTSCSSNSDSSGGSTTGTATGTPITVYTITAVDTPSGSFPGLVAAMNAAARSINAAGGVNGHPLKVQACNGKTDPNQEVACARSAASSNAAAVVAPLLVANPGGALKVLQDAGLADLAGAAAGAAELTNPISFPLDAGSFTSDVCLQMVQAGLATKVASVSSDIGPIKANADLVAGAAGALNIPFTGKITLPPTAPDLTSQMQQVVNTGADGVLLFATPNQAAQVLQASGQLGKKFAFCSSDGLLVGAQLAALGPAAQNIYTAATMPPLSDAGTNPAVASFVADMKAEEDSGDKAADLSLATYTSTSMRAWAGMQAFAQIAKGISGTVDRASFLTATKAAKNVTTGIFGPIDFTAPAGGAKFPSLYNTHLRLLKWDVDKKMFVSTDITMDVAKAVG